MSLSQMQKEQAEWSQRNFDNKKPYQHKWHDGLIEEQKTSIERREILFDNEIDEMGRGGSGKIDRGKKYGRGPKFSADKKTQYTEYPHSQIGKGCFFLKRISRGPTQIFSSGFSPKNV